MKACLKVRRAGSFLSKEEFDRRELNTLVNNSMNPLHWHKYTKCLGAKPDGPGDLACCKLLIIDSTSSPVTSCNCCYRTSPYVMVSPAIVFVVNNSLTKDFYSSIYNGI